MRGTRLQPDNRLFRCNQHGRFFPNAFSARIRFSMLHDSSSNHCSTAFKIAFAALLTLNVSTTVIGQVVQTAPAVWSPELVRSTTPALHGGRLASDPIRTGAQDTLDQRSPGQIALAAGSSEQLLLQSSQRSIVETAPAATQPEPAPSKSNSASSSGDESNRFGLESSGVPSPAIAPAQPPMFSNEALAAVVDARMLGCQAASQWPAAKMLEQRACSLLQLQSSAHHDSDRASARVVAQFLRHMAQRQRDIAAANALRAYYSWIANNELMKLSSDGERLLDQQSQTQAALLRRGVAIDDPTAIDRKRLENRDALVQLQASGIALQSTLQQLTGNCLDLNQSVVEPLEVLPANLNCCDCIQFALQHRNDYVAWLQLCQCTDEDTARQISELISPLAGGASLGKLPIGFWERLALACRADEIAAQVRRELRAVAAVQQSLIEQAVNEKCLALKPAYERVTIAEEMIRSWEMRIQALERMEQLGNAKGEAMVTARAELLKARTQLVSRKLTAKLTEVDLAEAMGGLANRCCRSEPWLVR